MKVEVAVLGSPSLIVLKIIIWSLWTQSNIELEHSRHRISLDFYLVKDFS